MLHIDQIFKGWFSHEQTLWLAGVMIQSNKYMFSLTTTFIRTLMVSTMLGQEAQYHLFTYGQHNQLICISFMTQLLYPHSPEDASGLMNVVQITEMTGHLIRFSSIS